MWFDTGAFLFVLIFCGWAFVLVTVVILLAKLGVYLEERWNSVLLAALVVFPIFALSVAATVGVMVSLVKGSN